MVLLFSNATLLHLKQTWESIVVGGGGVVVAVRHIHCSVVDDDDEDASFDVSSKFNLREQWQAAVREVESIGLCLSQNVLTTAVGGGGGDELETISSFG